MNQIYKEGQFIFKIIALFLLMLAASWRHSFSSEPKLAQGNSSTNKVVNQQVNPWFIINAFE
jgi:hypothetical protein